MISLTRRIDDAHQQMLFDARQLATLQSEERLKEFDGHFGADVIKMLEMTHKTMRRVYALRHLDLKWVNKFYSHDENMLLVAISHNFSVAFHELTNMINTNPEYHKETAVYFYLALGNLKIIANGKR